MNWIQIIVAALAFVVAGWFVADGSIAMITGEYVTPKSGEHAGKLGPWAKLVAKVGVEPRSFTMKLTFVIYGSLWLVAIALFLMGKPLAWWAMLIAAVGSLWYLPFGALLGILQLILLLTMRFQENA